MLIGAELARNATPGQGYFGRGVEFTVGGFGAQLLGVAVKLPRKIVEEASKRGISVEEVLIQALAKAAGLDPKTIAEARLELAEKYVEEGRGLVDTDPVQASEKLYKAAEETTKALAECYGLGMVARVEEVSGGAFET